MAIKQGTNCHMNKVSIFGCGRVGMSAAYALLLDGEVNELVLYGRNKDKIVGEQLDLEHGIPFLSYTNVIPTDSYEDLKGSDVIVFTAGAAQKPGETRLDLTKKNVAIVEETIPQIVRYAPGATIIFITNPVDILTLRASQMTDLPHGKIFGSGTALDTARFRFHLSEQLKVNPKAIHTYILGEHGDSSFPFISNATIGGQKLVDYPGFSHDSAMDAYQKTRDAAYKIIEAKGATYYAIGVVILQLVKAVLRDSRSIYSVSVPVQDYYGQSDISLSVPCIVGKNGVEWVLYVPLSDEEKTQFAHSADALREYMS